MKNSLSSSFRYFALSSISLLPIYGVSLGLNVSLADANKSSSQEQVVVKQKSIGELTLQDSGPGYSGVFKCNDGGTYYVRESEGSWRWYGESGDGVSWTNVFNGSEDDNGNISGVWFDVPKGKGRGFGRITVRRISRNVFTATNKTGGFSGSVWTRYPLR